MCFWKKRKVMDTVIECSKELDMNSSKKLNNNNTASTSTESLKINPFLEEEMDYAIQDNIRNYRPLNDVQINYLLSVKKEKLRRTLELYSDCNRTIQENFDIIIK